MHKSYSQSNCFFECSYNYASEKVLDKFNSTLKGEACTPWFFPSPQDVINICNPWQTGDFLDFMTDNIPDDKCSQCVPDCGSTIYEPMITAIPFRYRLQPRSR